MAALIFAQSRNGFSVGLRRVFRPDESDIAEPARTLGLSSHASSEALIHERVFIEHSLSYPFLYAGIGNAHFDMYRGNFKVSEKLAALVPLPDFEVLQATDNLVHLRMFAENGFGLEVQFSTVEERLAISFVGSNPLQLNRVRIALVAEPEEFVYGCGEQFSYLNLRGRLFPLWTSEQGVGRNKATRITQLADLDGGAGGDYWWTFFPQPSFVSSNNWWCGVSSSAYAEFDFRQNSRHNLYIWEIPSEIIIGLADTMAATVSDISDFFGRQGSLPSWCFDGVVLGVQGGTQNCLEKLERARSSGVTVAGIWAQDWQGINITSFGQRLRWNWCWDQERYPGLDQEIKRLKKEGVRFLGYINPYVGADMSLYCEAACKGYLAKAPGGEDYRVDFGEFFAGIVDLTNPEAFTWYKDVIKNNLIALGLSGWMADFGEYLPTDAVLYDGTSAEIAHNAWPALWAKCNREAVDEAVEEGLAAPNDLLFFMRAGGPGSQRFCPLMWAGDQNVDWSVDDGLPSVIPAALSLGLSGHGLHHSDIGGYTTLYGMQRTKELFMRWAELAALTVFMRTHEGNRPLDNWQFDSDDETLAHLAAMTSFHKVLKPYLEYVVSENSALGIPAMRPLFLQFEADRPSWTIQDQYLLGMHLLVAPVLEEGARARKLHLPAGEWVHLWSGSHYNITNEAMGTEVLVAAPLGEPPVFYQANSPWRALFEKAASEARRSKK